MRLKSSVVQIVVCLMLLFHLTMTRAEQDSASFEQAFNQARQLEHTGKTEQAIAAYDKLIVNYPDQPEPYNNLAVLLATQGKLDDARDRLEKAIHIDDIYATIYDNLSAVYVEMARGSYAKALQLGVTRRELALKDVETKATPITAIHSPVQTAELSTP
ncbi:MAG: tetratricopeptide repeat protein, partial [Gammaproteobacteria bacterium]|nr:tetratricopeptide repeat protein [Gammaproteobacteria bacterium]